jgi:glycosyltransferase involved in cell wall biosynthesis
MMKICFLADGPNSHTKKWVTYFASRDYEVHLITFRPETIPLVEVHSIPLKIPVGIGPAVSLTAKIGYFGYLIRVKRMIHKLSPDLLHAHYATSYGLMGAFSDYHPFVLSIWGSDVFDFPHKSYFHRRMIEYVMSRADAITATSRILTEETKKYLKNRKDIYTVPFGVDVEIFKPSNSRDKKDGDRIVIGVTKQLERKYGINYLLQAFARCCQTRTNLELWIVGEGSEETRLRSLCQRLNIQDRVRFLGFIPHEEIPQHIKQIDIAVIPSILESFGVAAVEASACGIPVVASRVGGLPEVVKDQETGFLVSPADSDMLSEKLSTLIENPMLRKKMGEAGRRFVLSRYVWEENAGLMDRVYQQVIERRMSS